MTGSVWICDRSIFGVVGVFLAVRRVLEFRNDRRVVVRGLDRWRYRPSSEVLSRRFETRKPKAGCGRGVLQFAGRGTTAGNSRRFFGQ